MQVNKSILKSILLGFLIPVVVVASLFWLSQLLNHRGKSDFTRLFPPHIVSNPKWIDLKFNSFYLAGLTKESIFLGNITAPAFILRSNFHLTDTGHIKLEILPGLKILEGAAEVLVDSPDIYMTEGITPFILHGYLNKPYLSLMNYHSPCFNSICQLSQYSFAMKTYNERLKENILAKYTFNSNQLKQFPGLLTKKGDGIFSLDGMISYDKSIPRLVYVYFYRNEFLNMDSNLQVISRGKTIDSIQTPQIKLLNINSDQSTIFSSIPLVVNISSCVDSGFLFVHSGLMAKNENERDFQNYSVIDMYSLKNNEYVYSFYIPDDNGVKMRNFRIINHRLVAMYRHSMMTFTISF